MIAVQVDGGEISVEGGQVAVAGEGPGGAGLDGYGCGSFGIVCVDSACVGGIVLQVQVQAGGGVYDYISFSSLRGKIYGCFTAVAAGFSPGIRGEDQKIIAVLGVGKIYICQIDGGGHVGYVEHGAGQAGHGAVSHGKGGISFGSVTGHGLIDQYVCLGGGLSVQGLVISGDVHA